jgi:hypothetical protein
MEVELCQPGTSVHRVHVDCISHVTLCHLLTHLGYVYNRSMQLHQYNNLLPLSSCLLCPVSDKHHFTTQWLSLFVEILASTQTVTE